MSYQADSGSHIMEPNSVGLGMFASVGFHAVLFVGMAFFPAASETVKKPLRIVNLLPPPSTSGDAFPTQAKTSTLEDILNNPLPDLSFGAPPLGSSDGGNLSDDSNNSAFFGNNRNLNSRVDTSDLTTVDIPIRSSSNSRSSKSPSPSTSRSTSSSSSASPPSSIVPAPTRTLPTPNIGASASSAPPTVVGAAPPPTPFPAGQTASPFPTGQAASPFPGVAPGSIQPQTLPGAGAIPPSQQTYQQVITKSLPYSYPQAACQEKATGRVSVDYLRKADGSLFEGSIQFDVQSPSSALNDAALNIVTNYPEAGTGALQRYLSPFEFTYSDEACAVANSEPSLGEGTTPFPPSNPGAESPTPETQNPESSTKAEEEESKSNTKKSKDKKNKKTQEKPVVTEDKKQKDPSVVPKEKPQEPQAPVVTPSPTVSPVPSSTPAPVPPVQPSPKPAEPVAPKPSPKPSEVKVEPATPAAKPTGNASDLVVPVEPVKPAQPIDAQPIEPAELKKLPEIKAPSAE